MVVENKAQRRYFGRDFVDSQWDGGGPAADRDKAVMVTGRGRTNLMGRQPRGRLEGADPPVSWNEMC